MGQPDVQACRRFAPAADGSPGADPPVRPSVAGTAAVVVRLIVAPFAFLAAAIAGLVFAVLLPICGIATISEGIARTSWRFARGSLTHLPHPRARRA